MNKTFGFLLIFIFLFSSVIYGQPLIKANIRNASCSGKPDGALELSIIGKAPFKIIWSNGESVEKIYDLAEGDYFVTVADANGQQGQAKFRVSAGSSIIISIDLLPSSNGDLKDISIKASGGSPSYTYYVSSYSKNGAIRLKQAENNFYKLEKRNYTINVEDMNGCISTANIDLR